MSLLTRHIEFLEALRGAGLPVSLAEGLDAASAMSVLSWDERSTVREAYAATLVKRSMHRSTFDLLFDLYFPRLVGEGVAAVADELVRDDAAALTNFRDRLGEAIAVGDQTMLARLAVEGVGRFGAMRGRGPGLSSWSAYTTLNRVAPQELTDRIVAALHHRRTDDEARRVTGRRLGAFSRLVEDEARRRIAEEKDPGHVARVAVRPSIDRLDFTSARRDDLDEMRRQIQPLARRLATRLTQERHARRRGRLDFRRTVRASLSTGGVPIATHHRPKTPHRSELVVLCDVSGSVANFAQFTLMLVFALRDQFQNVRAFTFVDQVHEVTEYFQPGADPAQVLADLAASTAHAALWGRTNYGRAFAKFAELDVLGPKSSLLILGDARSNYSDLSTDVLARLAKQARHSWWLNPEHPRHWDTGDSAARAYGDIVPMLECRNLTQLSEFVHDLV